MALAASHTVLPTIPIVAWSRKLLAKGVTVSEWVVMREMFDEDEISPGIVAERIGITLGGASMLVDRLVKKNDLPPRTKR